MNKMKWAQKQNGLFTYASAGNTMNQMKWAQKQNGLTYAREYNEPSGMGTRAKWALNINQGIQ